VRVQDIVIWSEHCGMTPDEIVSHTPSITLADVHSALAYYFDHVKEIRDGSERTARTDEQIPPAQADALRSRGIDETTTSDAGLNGTADREHLAFALHA
jgi:hypothetical protein